VVRLDVPIYASLCYTTPQHVLLCFTRKRLSTEPICCTHGRAMR
jgi:hypothetical protein